MHAAKRGTMNSFLVSLVLVPLTVQAAMAEEKKQVVQGEDLVVTATRTQERPIDVPVTTQVITKEEIELSGVTDVGDLVGKYVTGHYHK